PFAEHLKDLPHFPLAPLVHTGGGLIENDDLGDPEQGPTDEDTLQLPSGQVADDGNLIVREGDVREDLVHEAQVPLLQGMEMDPVDLVHRDGELGVEAFHLLWDIADAVAFDRDGSRNGLQETKGKFDQGGFRRSVLPDD